MNAEELQRTAVKERQAMSASERQINVCVGTGCQALGSDQIAKKLEQELKTQGKTGVKVKCVGCPGLCALGPLVEVLKNEKAAAQAVEPVEIIAPAAEDSPSATASGNGANGNGAVVAAPVAKTEVLYQFVTLDDVPEIAKSIGGEKVKRLECSTDQPFFTRQYKIVLENCGLVDPERIEDYIAVGGYQALHEGAERDDAQEVLDEITKSGLRGRGGAGFPTGLKWGTVAKASPDKYPHHLPEGMDARKYVICNGDEGDPGAFMDRSVLEGDPHRVLEGMAIAAYAVGASKGFIYVRAEYPLAVKRLRTAIRQAQARRPAGQQHRAAPPFNFDVDMRLGAGAFVCGEETALMASIEGKRGMPRPRPPFPAEMRLVGLPDADQQRRDVRQRRADHSQRRGLVRRHRHRKEQGHQGLRADRQDQEHRPDRSADGHHRCARSSTTSAAASRTASSSRPCRPAAHPAAASRREHLDTPVDYESLGKARLDHGFGRHDRDGRDDRHGRGGPVLHGILHGRIVRQVRSLPRRHRADAPPAGQDRRGQGHAARPVDSSKSCATW